MWRRLQSSLAGSFRHDSICETAGSTANMKRGCLKEKQMEEKLLGRINHGGGIEVDENSEDVGAQTVSHTVEIVLCWS